MAHAEKGRRERCGERVGLAEGGPERATPTAPTSLRMLRAPAVGTFRSAQFTCERRKWYVGPAFQGRCGKLLSPKLSKEGVCWGSVSVFSEVVKFLLLGSLTQLSQAWVPFGAKGRSGFAAPQH